MEIIERLLPMRKTVARWRQVNLRVALVPTMGALHEGHLSLVRLALEHADRVVVSLFVNPLQFGPNEDFDRYPRTLERDIALLESLNVDCLFMPSVEALYPEGRDQHTRVHVPGLADMLCGASRPGFFDGVATVVTKLFHIITPDVAVFGEKDYQQLLMIRRLVTDLNFPIRILGAPIVREPDGLALSSRNAYLSADERQCAPALQRSLKQLATALENGTPIAAAEQDACASLTAQGFTVDYLSVRCAETLALPSIPQQPLIVLAAAYLGTTRLIDNHRV